jgi:hypothetical protein
MKSRSSSREHGTSPHGGLFRGRRSHADSGRLMTQLPDNIQDRTSSSMRSLSGSAVDSVVRRRGWPIEFTLHYGQTWAPSGKNSAATICRGAWMDSELVLDNLVIGYWNWVIGAITRLPNYSITQFTYCNIHLHNAVVQQQTSPLPPTPRVIVPGDLRCIAGCGELRGCRHQPRMARRPSRFQRFPLRVLELTSAGPRNIADETLTGGRRVSGAFVPLDFASSSAQIGMTSPRRPWRSWQSPWRRRPQALSRSRFSQKCNDGGVLPISRPLNGLTL